MIHIQWKKMRGGVFAAALALSAAATLLPTSPALAQARALPDFTDLVEQVGPSVVNIRTLEKVAPRGLADGAGRDEMPRVLSTVRSAHSQYSPPGAASERLAAAR